MAKKRSGGRRMREEADDSDDGVSVTSVETRTTHASEAGDFYDSFERNDEDEQALDEAVEELTEKRTTTRVDALEKVAAHLLQYLPPDDVSESLVSNVLSCLRRPSEGEATRGARILGVLGLILGGDEERFFQRAKNVLEPIVTTSRSAKAKEAAIRALALCCFVCSAEEENTDEVMSLMERFFDAKIVGSICSAALESWGLLASTLSDEALSSDDVVDRMLPMFMGLLDHKDVDARSAAGENIALLFESAQRSSVTLSFDEEIVERLRVMSKDSSKKTSKKDRKTQRSVFRDIHATLASGEVPQLSFSVKSEVLDIRSWGSIRQFEAVKGCLQGGLQEHLKYNNVLRAILDLPETLEERVVDRRDVFNKKSTARKQRSNELKSDRRRKQNMQDAFLDDY